METEIKLLLPPASRAAVEAHPLLAAAPRRREELASCYYDTPTLDLRARGVTLRVRRAGDGWIQTVKGHGGGASFASRDEWEWPVASGALDLGALAREPEAARLVGDAIDRVAPVFTTRVARDLRSLTLDGGTAVEVAIDEGEILAGGRRAALDELEIELKGGPLAPMLRLADELSRGLALRLGTDSKSERGYALLTGGRPFHRGPDGVDLSRRAALGEAFPPLLGACARDLAADLSAAARGEVEGVHRLRAAIRRARTLLALFGPHLEPDGRARFDGALRDLGRVLGAGRDWDVFATETLAGAEPDIGAEAAETLRAAAAARRGAAQAAVRAAVEGPAPTRLLLGLALWTADAGWLKRGREADLPLRDLLPGLLNRLERRAAKRARHLRSLGAEDLHALRKSLKTLRYACEDVAPLFERGAAKPYVGKIKRVLADLGRINDAAVTEERVRDLGPGGEGPAAAALLAWNARRRGVSEGELRRHWRKLRRAEPFWA